MCRTMSIKRVSKNDPLRLVKRDAIKAGKELGYLPTTLNAVATAMTEATISRIMTTARNSGEIGSWVY